MLILIFLLVSKHFVVDFLLQGPYQYLNKGKYGHQGGLLHSLLHASSTAAVVLSFVNVNVAVELACLDFVLHYHIDWAKVQINQRFGWQCNSSEKFWWLLGLDQYLHSLTYILITYLAMEK